MKKTTATPNPEPLWRQQLHYRLKEGALIAMGALCLYLWMALLTYDQSDPGVHDLAERLLDQQPTLADRVVQRWIGTAVRYASA